MLTLAGIQLVLEYPGPEIELKIGNFIKKYISFSSYQPWLRPAWPGPNALNLTFPWPRPEPPFSLFKLRWPQSASRWATAHYLASSDQVAAILPFAYGDGGLYNPIPLMIGTPEIGNQVGQPGGPDNTITAQMYLMPPTPLSGIRGLTGQVQSLYLISLVDVRFFWYENSTGDLFVDTQTTWKDLYDNLTGRLGLMPEQFTVEDIDPEYLAPSGAMFNLTDQPIPFVLDAIAMNVGQRISAYFDGTFAARYAVSETTRLIADFQTNQATRIPVAGGARFADQL